MSIVVIDFILLFQNLYNLILFEPIGYIQTIDSSQFFVYTIVLSSNADGMNLRASGVSEPLRITPTLIPLHVEGVCLLHRQKRIFISWVIVLVTRRQKVYHIDFGTLFLRVISEQPLNRGGPRIDDLLELIASPPKHDHILVLVVGNG